jgi:hypothetical protein
MASIAKVIGEFQKKYSLDNMFADIIVSLGCEGKHLFDCQDIRDYIQKHKFPTTHLWRLDGYIEELVGQRKLIVFVTSPSSKSKKYMTTPLFRSVHMLF